MNSYQTELAALRLRVARVCQGKVDANMIEQYNDQLEDAFEPEIYASVDDAGLLQDVQIYVEAIESAK